MKSSDVYSEYIALHCGKMSKEDKEERYDNNIMMVLMLLVALLLLMMILIIVCMCVCVRATLPMR